MKSLEVPAGLQPIVEIDTEAPAAYIRLSDGKAGRTIVTRDDQLFAAVDFDRSGQLLGIEVVWPTKYGIEGLVAESHANVRIHPITLRRTGYVQSSIKP
jgi:uncharacterized protein YuzE